MGSPRGTRGLPKTDWGCIYRLCLDHSVCWFRENHLKTNQTSGTLMPMSGKSLWLSEVRFCGILILVTGVWCWSRWLITSPWSGGKGVVRHIYIWQIWPEFFQSHLGLHRDSAITIYIYMPHNSKFLWCSSLRWWCTIFVLEYQGNFLDYPMWNSF